MGPPDVVSVGEGFDFSAAVTRSGQLWTWGANDNSGDLCQGLTTSRTGIPPTRISGISNAVEVSGGQGHLLVLTSAGTVEACGRNNYGQLGDGKTTASAAPTQVVGLDGIHIDAISAGDLYSAALDSTGHVWEWGLNDFGQLGDGTTVNSDIPVEVKGLPGPVKEIFAGGSLKGNGQTVALLDNGSVYAWGSDVWGQLGNEQTEFDSPTPVRVDLPSGVTFTQVATGGTASYALDSSGDVWAWGAAQYVHFGLTALEDYILSPQEMASNSTQLSAVADVVVCKSSAPISST
jgi:alpha-tubulin suppressor-like RCC1 family protein